MYIRLAVIPGAATVTALGALGPAPVLAPGAPGAPGAEPAPLGRLAPELPDPTVAWAACWALAVWPPADPPSPGAVVVAPDWSAVSGPLPPEELAPFPGSPAARSVRI